MVGQELMHLEQIQMHGKEESVYKYIEFLVRVHMLINTDVVVVVI